VTAYPVKQYTVFVSVYCMNFVIFLCVTLKLFSFSFMPLLAPNPADATGGLYIKMLNVNMLNVITISAQNDESE